MASGRVIAVIDVGSNSVRLLVARTLTQTAFEVVDEEKFEARLGERAGGLPLSGSAMDRGLRALRLTRQIAASYGASPLVAVGTEALRRAPNADEFIARVAQETGVAIRIVSAQEEAYASFLGVVNSIAIDSGRILDIGGGSAELIDVQRRSFAGAQSAPLGALYACDRFLSSDPASKKEIRLLRKAVRQEFETTSDGAALVGVGGAVRNLARVVRIRSKYRQRLHGLQIGRAEIHRLATSLAALPVRDRRKVAGVSSSRSDILHAAAIVLDEVMDMTGAATLTVAGQGLREGLVWQDLRPEAPVLPDVRAASIAGLTRANAVDEMAAEPVASVAATLFDVLRHQHELGDEDAGLLVTAARLAGVGLHVDYYSRDRHAEYLVQSGDLHGFTHREIVLLGALVRCADSGSPDLAPFSKLLQSADSRRITMLASILGVARAVRRRVPSPVLGVHFELQRSALVVHLAGRGPLDAEEIALERQQRRFESAFGLGLIVSVSD
ncbi:MAG: Ppx/GppA phosphatase family protein [Dehalococcoidia bacterium]